MIEKYCDDYDDDYDYDDYDQHWGYKLTEKVFFFFHNV